MILGAVLGGPLGALIGYAVVAMDPQVAPRGYILPRFIEVAIAGIFVAGPCAIVGAALGLVLGLAHALIRLKKKQG